MKVTTKWLINKNACKSSLDYVCKNGYIGLDITNFLKKLIGEKRLSDANWLITRYMNKKQSVMYAIFAAEQISPKKYSKDKRLRKAIEAARNYLKRPCNRTIAAAADAGGVADAAGKAAAGAASAAYAAAAGDYESDYWDAGDAAYTAAAAAGGDDFKRNDIALKILENGLRIINNN